MPIASILPLLDKAIASRAHLVDSHHEAAFRLFNGFTEGDPNLSADIYAQTLVIHNYADDPIDNQLFIEDVVRHLRTLLDWLRVGIIKHRNGITQEDKRGKLLFGDSPDTKIREHGVWYALDLTMNRDASFYLDTSLLRKWLIENMKGKSVLNTFAYTGSFGVAALAGGASRVVQVDRNRRFLDLARKSYALNGFSINRNDLLALDFFPAVSRFKTGKQTFDCVVLDPPFFSSTSKGKVDQEKESARLINKVRPLVNDGGYLVAINNALYVSGKEYMQTLEELCKDGYLQIEELIPAPEHFIGYNIVGKPITDPAPFNHSTKIALLKVRRKG
ncbi:MAG: class I SAM-dependent methyltransferase [Anaerolineales bacterium]|nr:class I SAM-dependent methyltransferase [Anaerolineales bacterium]HNQ95926.1 class I SAM-dependent methyltransferase [Anaerolineales bacterium]